MIKLLKLLIISTSLQLLFTFAATAECLKLANAPLNVKAQKKLVADVKKTFRLAGLCASITTMPLPRMKHEMSLGNLDGEFFRVKSYIEQMKDYVVAIPTPAINNSGIIVTLKGSGFTPDSIREIGDKTIGVVRGAAWNKHLIPKIKSTLQVRNYLQLIQLLLRKRVDGFLIITSLLDRLEKDGKVHPDEIRRSSIVASFTLHIALHRKHQELIDRLDRALKKVKAEGGFDGS